MDRFVELIEEATSEARSAFLLEEQSSRRENFVAGWLAGQIVYLERQLKRADRTIEELTEALRKAEKREADTFELLEDFVEEHGGSLSGEKRDRLASIFFLSSEVER